MTYKTCFSMYYSLSTYILMSIIIKHKLLLSYILPPFPKPPNAAKQLAIGIQATRRFSNFLRSGNNSRLLYFISTLFYLFPCLLFKLSFSFRCASLICLLILILQLYFFSVKLVQTRWMGLSKFTTFGPSLAIQKQSPFFELILLIFLIFCWFSLPWML